MTTVEFFRSGSRWQGFRVQGHSGRAPRGEDLVCAALSALAQTAVIGLRETVGTQPRVRIRDGYLSCRLPRLNDCAAVLQSQAILDTTFRGFKAIEREFPKFVHVKEVE